MIPNKNTIGKVDEIITDDETGYMYICSCVSETFTDKGSYFTYEWDRIYDESSDKPSDKPSESGGFIDDAESNNIFMYGFKENTYSLKFEDANGVLESFDDVGCVNARTLSDTKIVHENKDLINYNIAPYSATKIGIYDTSNIKVGEMPLERFKPTYGERLYRFGLLSDVHNNSGADSGSENASSESREDLERALKFFNDKESVWATCIAGDLTDTGAEDQLQIYKTNVDTNSPNTPVYACAGNHDCRSNVSDEIWEQYTGNKRCFEITKGNDHFLFFGMSKESMGPSGIPYTQENIDWLRNKLDKYRNERCFIFMHLFFPDRSGNLKRIYTSNNWLGGNQLMQIQSLSDHYRNTVWFSGHSHWKWNSQMYEQKANVWKSDTSGWCVHIPSCAVPKYIANANAGTTIDPLASEGAIVDVYDNYIDIRAMDLKNGKYLPIGHYRLDTTLVSVASTKSIDDVMDELFWVDVYISSSTGQLSTAESGYSTSCYMPYDNTKSYVLTVDSSVAGTRVFFHDSNKVFISCTNQLAAGNHELIIPSNTAYIRVRSRRVSITNDDVYSHVSLSKNTAINFNGEYDEPHWFNSYINSSAGELDTDSNPVNIYATTAFISYDINKIYTFVLPDTANQTRIFYYDNNKSFISCTDSLTELTHVIDSVPDGTVYFRFRTRTNTEVSNYDTFVANITCTIVQRPTYNVTNIVATLESADSTDPFDGVGYRNNAYISSSSLTETTTNGYVLTGFIPITVSESSAPTIYVKGVTVDITSTLTRLTVYDSNKQNPELSHSSGISYYYIVEELSEKYYKITPAYAESSGNTKLSNKGIGTLYVRFSFTGVGENLIMTLDQPIE